MRTFTPPSKLHASRRLIAVIAGLFLLSGCQASLPPITITNMNTACADGDCEASNSTTTSNTSGQVQAGAAGEGVELPELPDPFEPGPRNDAGNGAGSDAGADAGSADVPPFDGGAGDAAQDAGTDAGGGAGGSPDVGPLLLLNPDIEGAGVAEIQPLYSVYGADHGGEPPMVAAGGNNLQIISLRAGNLAEMFPAGVTGDPEILGLSLNFEPGFDSPSSDFTILTTGFNITSGTASRTYLRRMDLPIVTPFGATTAWNSSPLGSPVTAMDSGSPWDVTQVMRKSATDTNERFFWWIAATGDGVKIARSHQIAGQAATLTYSTVPPDTRTLHAIHAMVKDASATGSPITVVAVGENGEVLVSTDGAGTVFTRDTGLGGPAFAVQRSSTTTSPHLYGVWFAAPNPALDMTIVGEAGTVARRNGTGAWENLGNAVTGSGHLRGVFGAVAGSKLPVMVAGDGGLAAWADFSAAAPVFRKLDADNVDNQYLLRKTDLRAVWGTTRPPAPNGPPSSVAFWLVGSTFAPIFNPEPFGAAWTLEFVP